MKVKEYESKLSSIPAKLYDVEERKKFNAKIVKLEEETKAKRANDKITKLEQQEEANKKRLQGKLDKVHTILLVGKITEIEKYLEEKQQWELEQNRLELHKKHD
jgi:hypothetical protein